MLITNVDVLNAIDESFYAIQDYIVRIANIFARTPEQKTPVCRALLNASVMCDDTTAVAFRAAFIESLREEGFDDEGLIQQALAAPLVVHQAQPVQTVAVQRRPHAVPQLAFYLEEKRRLLATRKRADARRGKALADAALDLEGWFHWVPSGPKVPGLKGHVGSNYGPKTSWNPSQVSAWEVDRWFENDFAKWMVEERAPTPNRRSHLNCWESLMFSAFWAGLVGKTTLQTAHRRAALNFEFHHTEVQELPTIAKARYDRSLLQFLNFGESAPFLPEMGLIPQKGDILFFNHTEHVAVSLGRTWTSGGPRDLMMSLWYQNNGSFAKLVVGDESEKMLNGLRFVPCPF